MKRQLSVYFKDIRFWILFFFIIRLYGITNPPLEGASNWRQCDGLMIARNFYEHNHNILYPEVDIAGDSSGIVGCEFPLLNYTIYLLSLIFGFHDWFGRLINLTISSIGIFFFYKLIKKFFEEPTAFYASLVLLVSMWFGYSRITIPDTVAASLCIISAYHGFHYLEQGKLFRLILFLIFGVAGCLAKISSATLLTIFLLPFLNRKIPVIRKVIFSGGAFLILLSVCVWYFYWVPYLNSIGLKGHFFMGQPLTDGIKQLVVHWQRALSHFYDTPLKYTGFILFAVSMFLVIKNKKWMALAAFTIPFSAFVYIILVAGVNFTVNSYYPLMMVPSMAFMAGYGLTLVKSKRWVYFTLIVVGIEGIANQIHTFSIRYPFKAFSNLELILNEVGCKKSDLITINPDEQDNPMPLYMAHRKGWNIPNNESFANAETISYLRQHHCKYIVIMDIIFGSKVDLPFEKIYESREFIIYKL